MKETEKIEIMHFSPVSYTHLDVYKRQMHFLIGLTGIIMAFLLCSLSFYLGADAIQGVLDFIPDFVLAGFGVAGEDNVLMSEPMREHTTFKTVSYTHLDVYKRQAR